MSLIELPSRLLLAALLSFLPCAMANAAPEYVEGEVIVTFKEGIGHGAAEKNLKARAMKFARHFPALSAQQRKQVGVLRSKTKTTVQLIKELRNDPTIEFVEPNYLYQPNESPGSPNDSLFPHLWALHNTGQRINGIESAPGSDIGFIAASILAPPTTVEPVVAVIDSGIDLNHPDLMANLWVNGGEIPGNGIDDDGNGLVDDVHGVNFLSASGALETSLAGYHGTHVAGTIAATGHNGTGVIGANSGVRLMALKVGNDGEGWNLSEIIGALDYVVLMKSRGVNIIAINASYNGGPFSEAHRDAIDAAGQAGVIFCNSAGNNTSNNDTISYYPSNYRLSNMIVVASSDHQDNLSSFSNYGATTVDLAAPGSDILSTMPDGKGAVLHIDGSLYYATPLTFSGTGQASGHLIDCGSGTVGQFPPGVDGNIALIERGGATFAENTANAMAAGASAVVIYDNVVRNTPFQGNLAEGEWVPTVMIRRVHGLALVESLQSRPIEASLSLAAGPSYGFLSGTSMAAPQVSAAVAFAAMHFPNDTVAQRIARVLNAVDVKSSFFGKTITGGRLNLQRIIDPNALSPRLWDGGGGDNTNVNLNTNWSGDVTNALNGTSYAVFGSNGSRATINIDAWFARIEINRLGNFEIADGPGQLTIGSGGIKALQSSMIPGYAFVISESNLVLHSSQIWEIYDAANGEFVVSSAVSGNGCGITKTNVGILTFSGIANNTYNGRTEINSGMLDLRKTGASAVAGNLTIGDGYATPGLDILRLSGTGGNQISDTSILTFNGRNTNAGVFRLNGLSETVGGLVSARGEGVVENNSSTASILTLDVNDSNVFTGIIRDGADGSLAMVKAGNGTQTLRGPTTYSAGTVLRSGTLAIAAGDVVAFPPPPADTIVAGGAINHPDADLSVGFNSGDNATFEINGGSVSNNDGNIGYSSFSTGMAKASGGIWTNTGTLNVGAAGSGTLEVSGTGTVSSTSIFLGVSASGNGALHVNGGMLTTAQVAKGSGSGIVTFNGGILKLTDAQTNLFSGFEAGSIQLLEAGGIIDTQTFTVATNATFGGIGSLAKSGSGSLTLTGSNAYTGDTTINSGTLRIGGGSDTGSLVGNIINNGELIFDRSNSFIYNGAVSGSGSFSKLGAGTTTLTGAHSHSGGTFIKSGTLAVSSGGSINQSAASLYTGHVSGDNGTLLINGGAVASNFTFVGHGAGSIGAATVSSGSLSSNGGLIVGDFGSGVLNVTGGSVTSGYSILGVGGGASGTVNVSAGTWSDSSDIYVGQVGTGILNLTGSGVVNAYSGLGRVFVGFFAGGNGTLNLGTGSAAGTLNAGMVSGGGGSATLNFNHTGNYTFASALVGSLVVNKLGSGTTTLTGTAANAHTGGTTIRSGTLILGKTGTTALTGNITIGDGAATAGIDILQLGGTGTNQIADSSILTFNGSGSNAGTFRMNGLSETIGGLASTGGAGIVENHGSGTSNLTLLVTSSGSFSGILRDGASGKLALVKDGGATLAITGPITYTGNTTVENGTLSLTAATLADTSTLTIGSSPSSPAVLNLNHSSVDVVAALVIDGQSKASGLYDSTNSGGAITGTGKIQVGFISPYKTWLAGNPGMVDGNPLGDFDKDGILNVLEFVLNGNPTGPDSGILPTLDVSGPDFVFAFNRRADSTFETTQVFQFSSTLQQWTDVPITGVPATGVSFGAILNGMEPVTIRVPKGSNAKLFGRLKVLSGIDYIPTGNLLQNGSGANPPTTGWNIIANGGNGWYHNLTDGYDGTPGFFRTSYGWCRRSQIIDLVAAGASPATLDAQPLIRVGEAISSFMNNNLPDSYYIKVELRNANQNVIATWNAGTFASPLAATENWVFHQHDFTNYGPGVRYIYFEDGGIDNGFWSGPFGTYHDAASVEVIGN